MPINGKQQKIEEDGQQKDGYSVTFTDDAYLQLQELLAFTKTLKDGPDFKNELDVIKFGISILQGAKDAQEKKASNQKNNQES